MQSMEVETIYIGNVYSSQVACYCVALPHALPMYIVSTSILCICDVWMKNTDTSKHNLGVIHDCTNYENV